MTQRPMTGGRKRERRGKSGNSKFPQRHPRPRYGARWRAAGILVQSDRGRPRFRENNSRPPDDVRERDGRATRALFYRTRRADAEDAAISTAVQVLRF